LLGEAQRVKMLLVDYGRDEMKSLARSDVMWWRGEFLVETNCYVQKEIEKFLTCPLFILPPSGADLGVHHVFSEPSIGLLWGDRKDVLQLVSIYGPRPQSILFSQSKSSRSSKERTSVVVS
jgi:hypothetical protein